MNCEAFGHVVMKFGGELYRFPADSEPRRWDGLDVQIPKETWQFEDFSEFLVPKRPQER